MITIFMSDNFFFTTKLHPQKVLVTFNHRTDLACVDSALHLTAIPCCFFQLEVTYLTNLPQLYRYEICITFIMYLSLHSNSLLFKTQLLGSLKQAFHYIKYTITQKQTDMKEKSDQYQTLQSFNYWFSLNVQSNRVCG